jgi:pimeloyl-ACP methyl ester carboxylesterase
MSFLNLTLLLIIISLALAQTASPPPLSPPPPPEAVPGYPSLTYPTTTTNLAIKTGYLPFRHPSIPTSVNAQTWFRIATPKIQPDSSTGPSTPLIVLHGGSGLSHVYLQPTLDLYAQQAVRTVIYYDQFGGGNSTRYPASRGNTSFWTPELFMDELDNVLAHLLQDGQPFDIYGHSWGGMLATKYVAERQPAKLNKVCLLVRQPLLKIGKSPLEDCLENSLLAMASRIKYWPQAGRATTTTRCTLMHTTCTTTITCAG